MSSIDTLQYDTTTKNTEDELELLNKVFYSESKPPGNNIFNQLSQTNLMKILKSKVREIIFSTLLFAFLSSAFIDSQIRKISCFQGVSPYVFFTGKIVLFVVVYCLILISNLNPVHK